MAGQRSWNIPFSIIETEKAFLEQTPSSLCVIVKSLLSYGFFLTKEKFDFLIYYHCLPKNMRKISRCILNEATFTAI